MARFTQLELILNWTNHIFDISIFRKFSSKKEFRSIIINGLFILLHTFVYICSIIFQMRFVAVIFSIYMLVLTAIPCIDSYYDVNSPYKTELTQENHASHHHNDSDNCSPFCTCNCCATSVVFHTQMAQLTCFSFTAKQYFPVTSVFISDPLANIWQPPKIA